MRLLHRFLSRRWLLAFAVVLVIAGVPMLHPYPRQSLFGPTIRAKPWCAWEDALRRHVHHQEHEKTLSAKMLRWLGYKGQDPFEGKLQGNYEVLDDVEMLPVVLALADGKDPIIRKFAVRVIYQCDTLQQKSAAPVLRRRLDDECPECRMQVASVLWEIEKDERLVPALLRELNKPLAAYEGPLQRSVARGFAIALLARIAHEAPEWFSEVAARATDPDRIMRGAVMEQMRRFGKKGVPVLIQGLGDEDKGVRLFAIHMLTRPELDAAEAVPALLNCLPEADLHDPAVDALQCIDWLRFQDLQRKNE